MFTTKLKVLLNAMNLPFYARLSGSSWNFMLSFHFYFQATSLEAHVHEWNNHTFTTFVTIKERNASLITKLKTIGKTNQQQ